MTLHSCATQMRVWIPRHLTSRSRPPPSPGPLSSPAGIVSAALASWVWSASISGWGGTGSQGPPVHLGPCYVIPKSGPGDGAAR
jgi:hypothetical protein